MHFLSKIQVFKIPLYLIGYVVEIYLIFRILENFLNYLKALLIPFNVVNSTAIENTFQS